MYAQSLVTRQSLEVAIGVDIDTIIYQSGKNKNASLFLWNTDKYEYKRVKISRRFNFPVYKFPNCSSEYLASSMVFLVVVVVILMNAFK